MNNVTYNKLYAFAIRIVEAYKWLCKELFSMTNFHLSLINEPCSLKTEISWRVKPEVVNQYE